MKKYLDLIVTHIIAYTGYIYFFKFCKGIIYNQIELDQTIEKHKRFIVAMNHESYLDWIIVWAIFRYRYKKRITFLAKEKLFDHPVWGMIMRHASCVKVSNSGSKIIDLDGKRRLENSIIGIFPEGKRSRSGELQEFKSGVAVMASRLNIPILPLSLNNFYEAWSPGSKTPKILNLNIVIGQLIEPTYPLKELLNKVRYEITVGRDYQEINKRVFNQAVFDLDSTLAKTSIADLLFYMKKKRSSHLGYYLWLLKISPLIPLLKLIDKINRPLVQMMVYSMYSAYNLEQIKVDAEEFVKEHGTKKLIPPTSSLLHQLEASQTPIIIISTNIDFLVQQFAKNLNVKGRGIDLSYLRNSTFKEGLYYLSSFKSNEIAKTGFKNYIGFGDSKYDKAIFQKSSYSILVCKKTPRPSLASTVNNYISA